jgi:hypothetical protein
MTFLEYSGNMHLADRHQGKLEPTPKTMYNREPNTPLPSTRMSKAVRGEEEWRQRTRVDSENVMGVGDERTCVVVHR